MLVSQEEFNNLMNPYIESLQEGSSELNDALHVSNQIEKYGFHAMNQKAGREFGSPLPFTKFHWALISNHGEEPNTKAFNLACMFQKTVL